MFRRERRARQDVGPVRNSPPTYFRRWLLASIGVVRCSAKCGDRWFRLVIDDGRIVLDRARWYCGLGEVVAYFLFDPYSLAEFNHAEERAMASLSERLLKQKNAKGKVTTIKDDVAKKQLPNLWDFLTTTEVAGEIRKTGTMNLFLDEGKFKAFLNDRESGLYAVCTADGLASLLSEVEGALAGDSLDWRVQRPYKGPRKG